MPGALFACSSSNSILAPAMREIAASAVSASNGRSSGDTARRWMPESISAVAATARKSGADAAMPASSLSDGDGAYRQGQIIKIGRAPPWIRNRRVHISAEHIIAQIRLHTRSGGRPREHIQSRRQTGAGCRIGALLAYPPSPGLPRAYSVLELRTLNVYILYDLAQVIRIIPQRSSL